MHHPIPVVLASAAALGLAVVGLSPGQGTTPAQNDAPVRVAYALGFTPESCALAGLSASESADALNSLRAAESLRDNLRSAEIALDAAIADFAAANSAVRRGLVSEDRLASLAFARTRVAEAREGLESAKEVLNRLLIAEHDDETRERFANYMASAAFNVPAEYRVLGYSDAAWEEIAAAVRQQQRIEAGVLDPSAADVDAIIGVETNLLVVEARQRLGDNLADIEQAFAGFAAR